MTDMNQPVDQSPCKSPNMLAAALEYARNGLSVFPLHTPLPDGSCSCGSDHRADPNTVGKHPRTSNGLKAATVDEAKIESWWKQWPDANIGVLCGTLSGIFILDVDGPEGERSLQRLTGQYGPLPATRKILTGKGYHLYFRHPSVKVRSAAPIDREFPGLDSRGDGASVVGAPSLHYTGKRYTVDPVSPEQVAESPAWLVDFINRRPRASPEAANHAGFDEGSRNATLASLAGSMRARGMSQGAIEAALLTTNQQQCKPPLPEDEVRRIALSIARYPVGASHEDLIQSLNDKGNAERFVAQHKLNVRYVPERGRWLVWNGTCWVEDVVGQIVELAKQTASLIFAEAIGIQSNDLQKLVARHAQLSHQLPRLEAMVKLAASDPAVVVREHDLDSHDWLLGVRNGAIDLRSGHLQPHRREDLLTRIAPVKFDPEARCPIWRAFIDKVTGADADLAGYVQRMFGYCLTGMTQEQVFFFLFGSGANGKSTYLNVLREILGSDLARQTSYETLTHKKQGRGPTNDLARLQGVRAALTTEIEDGSHLDETLVKQLTGGDPIAARFLYREFSEYIPKFKFLIAGNHKPVIRGDDHGMWRRVHLVPFTVTIPENERDQHLPEKLREEYPGILNWALEGCMAWQRGGLRPPKAVLDAVEEYRTDSDILGQWVAECCEEAPGKSITASDAYDSYRWWARENGLRPMSNASFGRKLSERYLKRKTNKQNVYEGLTFTR